MNGLRDFGLSGELSKGEFERKLLSKSPDEVKELRRELFEEAVMKGLTEEGDMLVMRRKVGVGKSVKNKHVEDVWALVGTIQRCEAVPRVLLRNGKRCKKDLEQSRVRELQHRPAVQSMSAGDESATAGGDESGRHVDGGGAAMCENDVHMPSTAECEVALDEVALDADSRVFRSTLIGNVNKLKSDVSALKTDVRQCKLSIGSLSPALPHSRGVSFCWLYVSLCVVGAGVGKVELERLLCCQVIQYVRLTGCTQLAFKVKILESDLRVALESGRVSGCRVHLWKNSPGSVAQQGSIGGLDERVISGASKRVIFAKLCISQHFQGNIHIVFQEISGVRGCELFWGLE